MTSKKQERLIRNLKANLPKGNQQYYDRNTLESISKLPEYLPYTDLYGVTQTIPVCEEDKAFLMRESDMPTFYARTCVKGEKIVLMYDSKSGRPPQEVQINHPCTRNPSKYYSTEALKSCNEVSPEKDYILIWEVQNHNNT